MPATYTDRLDGLTTSVAVKAPCRVATTGPIQLSGLQTIDGVTLATGDRVLVKDQANKADNGIWMAFSGAWTRALDFDGARDVVGGTQVSVLEGSTNNDTYWRPNGVGIKAIGTDALTFEAALLNSSATQSLTAAGSGAIARTVQDKLRETVSVTDYGADPTGTTDSTDAVQAGIDYLASVGGGTLWIPGNFLVGGLTITSNNIHLRGRSRDDRLTVKNGTTGITWSGQWGSIRSLGIWSEGTESDGLGTSGVLFSRGASGLSAGHFSLDDCDFQGFNGFGFKAVNALDFAMRKLFYRNCVIGLWFARGGTAQSDFTTTISADTIYFSSCTTGCKMQFVYRSTFRNVIGEGNVDAIDINIGNISLDRAYFEGNTGTGCKALDAFVFENEVYSNAAGDLITRTWTPGVVTASGRGYSKAKDMDAIAKRFGVLAGFGVGVQYIAEHGTTAPIGLKYGTATLAMKRGSNLLDPAAWEGEGGGGGGGAEFVGWVAAKGGYEVSGALTGARGMRQSVMVTAGQTYVLDWQARNVSGAEMATARVGSDTVTNGVVFTATDNGSVVIKLFGNQSGAHENVVSAISLSRVDAADPMTVADMQDRLSRALVGRGLIYMAAPPASGAWARAERVWNSAPSAGGAIGWVCVTAGSPGTWKAFGTIAS